MRTTKLHGSHAISTRRGNSDNAQSEMEVRNQDEIGLISPCITGSNPVSTSSYNTKTLSANCCEGHFFSQTKNQLGLVLEAPRVGLELNKNQGLLDLDLDEVAFSDLEGGVVFGYNFCGWVFDDPV
ncbi:MAG: hypothetical protein ISS41_11370, partial [Candidatus Aminicenantes bacterium]|nr:hypothetical protein [Candidatus Aminicenantes bacterium]